MAEPICKKCGGKRKAMQNTKGTWFVGCEVCNLQGAKKPPADKEGKKKPDEKPAPKNGSWLDDYV